MELGVQSVYDFVLTRMQRGHGVAEIVRANQVLRDSALKVGFHMMPHLPGSDSKLDLRGFENYSKILASSPIISRFILPL